MRGTPTGGIRFALDRAQAELRTSIRHLLSLFSGSHLNKTQRCDFSHIFCVSVGFAASFVRRLCLREFSGDRLQPPRFDSWFLVLGQSTG